MPIFPVYLEKRFGVLFCFGTNSPNHHTVLKISAIPERRGIGSSSPEGARVNVCGVCGGGLGLSSCPVPNSYFWEQYFGEGGGCSLSPVGYSLWGPVK